jgi:DHA2 family multidrug resistance protein-like MFS transporter
LIPLDLLKVDAFRLSVVASVLCFTGVAAALVALPFHLQHEVGLNIWMTGLYLTPWPLMVAIAAPITARLTTRVSTAWLCAAGGACLALGLAASAAWPAQQHAPLIASILLCGLGFGLFQVPNNQSMFLAAPQSRSGAAGGMQGTARLTGQTIGAILMTLLFTLAPDGAAPRIGLAIASVFALAAGLVSLRRVWAPPLHRPATRHPRGSRFR